MVRPYYNYDYLKRRRAVRPSLHGGMTPVVRTLLIVNIIVFVLQVVFGNTFTMLFGLSNTAIAQGFIWQIFTYMFLHSTGYFLHLVANMLGLYLLGPEVERGMGSRHFLIMYFISGILGGVGWLALSGGGICIGASGAIMGMVASFAALYPRRRLAFILLPMYPVKAWIIALIFGGLELFLYLSRPDSSIAHTVHLAGGVAGCFYTLAVFRPQVLHAKWLAKWLRHHPGTGRKPPGPREMTPAELDRILDKISKHGMSALNKRERDMLESASSKSKRRRR